MSKNIVAGHLCKLFACLTFVVVSGILLVNAVSLDFHFIFRVVKVAGSASVIFGLIGYAFGLVIDSNGKNKSNYKMTTVPSGDESDRRIESIEGVSGLIEDDSKG